MQIRISLRSRSDLVLDADHALDLYPISFCRRVSHFVAFQTKVAHLCLCLVHIKMPLLMWCNDYVMISGGFLGYSRCRKRRSAKGVRSLFSFLVTFWSLFLKLLWLFSSLYCQTPFAGLLLRQGEILWSKKIASRDGRVPLILLSCPNKGDGFSDHIGSKKLGALWLDKESVRKVV